MGSISPAGVARRERVVLVDSASANARMRYRQLLARGGYDVAEAADAREAAELARGTRPAVILVDHEEPPAEQHCARCRSFKANVFTSGVPLVALCSQSDVGASMRSCDVVAAISKPPSLAEVLDAIASAEVTTEEQRLPPTLAPGGDTPSSAPAPARRRARSSRARSPPSFRTSRFATRAA